MGIERFFRWFEYPHMLFKPLPPKNVCARPLAEDVTKRHLAPQSFRSVRGA